MNKPVAPDKTLAIMVAVSRAWNLGQIYSQQGESESYSDNKKKAEDTFRKFQQLVVELEALLNA